MTFSYKAFVSLFGHCQLTVPYMKTISIFGRFVRKVMKLCFSDSFVKKTTQQSDGSCNITSDSQLLKKFQKEVSLFVQTHMKNNLRVKNDVLLTTMTRYASYPFAEITPN